MHKITRHVEPFDEQIKYSFTALQCPRIDCDGFMSYLVKPWTHIMCNRVLQLISMKLCVPIYQSDFSCIFTAPKRSLRRLCFYTCLSVIVFTGGGCVCMAGGGVRAWGGACIPKGMCVWRGLHGCEGHAWQQACLGGHACPGVHVWGACMAGGCVWPGSVHAMHDPPVWYYEIRSVNERAVRILLECILVMTKFPQYITTLILWFFLMSHQERNNSIKRWRIQELKGARGRIQVSPYRATMVQTVSAK